MVVVVLASLAGKVTVPFETIDFTACQAHERFAAGIQYYHCINEYVHNLVRMQFLVQHDNQSTPRSALGDYWVNREAAIRVLCTRAPSSRSSRVRA